jgi:hypothetical protein
VYFQVNPLGRGGIFFVIAIACSSVIGIVWTPINLAIILPPLLIAFVILLLESTVDKRASFPGE